MAGVISATVGLVAVAEGATQRVSLGAGAAQGSGVSGHPSLGATGAFVVFSSTAGDLVAGDTNGAEDAFFRNLTTGLIERLSVSSAGVQGNAKSLKPIPSTDGTIITFQSSASNLEPGDTNGKLDVFVRDRAVGVTRRVSVPSANGEANGDSNYPQISRDGRYVVFQSTASNLAGSDPNVGIDVFRHELATGATVHVSVGVGGTASNGQSQYPAISADGRYVAFQSSASNLVPGDSNRQTDVFFRDLQSGRTERLSISSGGVPGNRFSGYPDISDDGRYVTFISRASNLVAPDTNGFNDLFIRDRATSITTRLTRGLGGAQVDGDTISPEMSGSGRHITFGSEASNLVASDTNGVSDVFLLDRDADTIRRVSVGTGGQQGAQRHFQQQIADDGSTVVFSSGSDNLVADDTNIKQDVFMSY